MKKFTTLFIICLLFSSCNNNDDDDNGLDCECYRVIDFYEDFELVDIADWYSDPGSAGPIDNCDQESWPIYYSINENPESPNFGDGNVSYMKCKNSDGSFEFYFPEGYEPPYPYE